jgi:hypothetical protein
MKDEHVLNSLCNLSQCSRSYNVIYVPLMLKGRSSWFIRSHLNKAKKIHGYLFTNEVLTNDDTQRDHAKGTGAALQ